MTTRDRIVHNRLMSERIAPRHSNGRPRKPYRTPQRKPRTDTRQVGIIRIDRDGSVRDWPSIRAAVIDPGIGLNRRQIGYAIKKMWTMPDGSRWASSGTARDARRKTAA